MGGYIASSSVFFSRISLWARLPGTVREMSPRSSSENKLFSGRVDQTRERGGIRTFDSVVETCRYPQFVLTSLQQVTDVGSFHT